MRGTTTKHALALALCVTLWAVPVCAQQSETDVFVAQAILAYDEKRYAEALGLLNEALKVYPDHVDALYYTGLVHLAQKKPDLAVRSLEKARNLNPTDLVIRYQLGVAYFTLEQYDNAAPLLEDVFKEQPRLESLGYYVGFMRYRQKDYQGALRAFSAGTSTDPTIQQVTRFYAGLALGILGLPERAATEVEEALRIQPVSPLTGPAERIRDTILSARERERRLRAEVRLGGFYDDNISTNPRPSADPLAEELRRARKGRGGGELASARLEYSWLREGPWEATATYSFLQTLNHKNDRTDLAFFNIQNHLGGLGGFYRGTVAALPYQLGTQYTYDYLTLNEIAFLHRHTGTIFGTLVENPGNLTTALGRVQFKEFLNDDAGLRATPQERRDAKNWLAGLIHVFRFEADKHTARIGYQLDYEDAKGSNFSYWGHRGLLGGQVTLPWEGQTRLRYDYELHRRLYSNVYTLLPITAPNTVQRSDTEQLHVVRIEQPLPNNFTLSAEYQGTRSTSNLNVFSFDRNTFSLILTWQY